METTQRIVDSWLFYVEMNSLKAGTKKYQEAQHAFVCGANALTGDKGLPPIIQIYVMSGRDIADIAKEQATA